MFPESGRGWIRCPSSEETLEALLNRRPFLSAASAGGDQASLELQAKRLKLNTACLIKQLPLIAPLVPESNGHADYRAGETCAAVFEGPGLYCDPSFPPEDTGSLSLSEMSTTACAI